MTHDWTPPEYLSPSQISSLLTCGEQFRLTRVVGVPERPMWASIGGSVVHELTEMLDYDLASPGIAEIEGLWPEFWERIAAETLDGQPTFSPDDYYVAGGKSRARPKKEDPEWWSIHGPKFVASWVQWRNSVDMYLNPDLVEVEAHAYHDNLVVKSVTDRIFEDPNGDLRIVDLKSGAYTPAWPQQLALNALCLRHEFDMQPKWGGFWKARAGGVPIWFDLEKYTDAWLWSQVGRAKKIRDQQLFVAQPSMLCETACGVRDWCVAMGGEAHPLDPDATLTHNGEA